MSNQDSVVTRGVQIAVVGAVVLVISCFLPWWDQGGAIGDLQEFGTGSSTLTAFQKQLNALIIVACGIGALVLALRIRSDRRRLMETSHRYGVMVLGLIAAFFVVLGMVSPPEPTFAGESLGDPASPVFGIWIALVSALALAAGGLQINRATGLQKANDRPE